MRRLRLRGRVSVLVVSVFLCFLLVVPAFGGWSTDSISGNWIVADRHVFRAGDGDGEAVFSNLAVANFSGYSVCLNFSQFKNHAAWFDLFQVEKTCKFFWNVSGIYVDLEFGDVHNLGGLLDNYWVYFASSQNRSDFGVSWWDWGSTKQGRDHWDFVNDVFYVYVVLVNSTAVRVSEWKDKGVLHGGMTQLCSSVYEVASNWSASVDISLNVHDSGNGVFFCNFGDSVGGASEPSSFDVVTPDNPLWNFFSNLNGLFGHVLPKWMTDFIGSLSGWFGWLQPVLGALWGALLMVLPFLPFLLLMYVVDAGVASFSQGSFQPIGAVFTSLYQLGSQAIGALVSIVSAVWSFIKFW